MACRGKRIATAVAAFCALLLLAPLHPPSAHAALPQEASVPGGVALIPLGPMSTNDAPPLAWYGQQQVLVTADDGQWVAVLGLALDTAPGAHELLVDSAGEWLSLIHI